MVMEAHAHNKILIIDKFILILWYNDFFWHTQFSDHLVQPFRANVYTLKNKTIESLVFCLYLDLTK